MEVVTFLVHYLGQAVAMCIGAGALFAVGAFLTGDIKDRRQRAKDYNPDE